MCYTYDKSKGGDTIELQSRMVPPPPKKKKKLGRVTLKDQLRTLFFISYWRRDRHFTWSSEPREGPAVYRAKAELTFISQS